MSRDPGRGRPPFDRVSFVDAVGVHASQSSAGTSFCDGKPRMTRDRLTSPREAEIVVVASDTRHRFRVPVAPPEP